MKTLISSLLPALRATLVLAFITCGAYPLFIYGVAQFFFPEQAHGSLITHDGKVIGSALLGQNFAKAEYFHPRPSAAGNGYDAASSSGSNLGPTSEKLRTAIQERLEAYRQTNGLTNNEAIPADAVTASASGLDPHISVKNAQLQTARVAQARGLGVERVRSLIAAHTLPPELGFLGEKRVNVLQLNLALDKVR